VGALVAGVMVVVVALVAGEKVVGVGLAVASVVALLVGLCSVLGLVLAETVDPRRVVMARVVRAVTNRVAVVALVVTSLLVVWGAAAVARAVGALVELTGARAVDALRVVACRAEVGAAVVRAVDDEGCCAVTWRRVVVAARVVDFRVVAGFVGAGRAVLARDVDTETRTVAVAERVLGAARVVTARVVVALSGVAVVMRGVVARAMEGETVVDAGRAVVGSRVVVRAVV
jgi:hypothetical protein